MEKRIRSKKVKIDGYTFDSETEAEYYAYLRQRIKDGVIAEIEVHPSFILQPAFERFGVKYKQIKYIADFLVRTPEGKTIIIDVKGWAMEDAHLKRKIFAFKYPDLELRWIAASKKFSTTGWIDYDELQRIRAKNRREKRKER